VTPEARLEGILKDSPTLMWVLEGLRGVGLPGWRLASGCIYQTAWNALTGRDPDFGIKDYDALYFDPDMSWDAEDVWIKRTAAVFAPGLGDKVEVRNQARVHLWFEQKFGEPYEPLANADEALERFVCPAFAVGARLEADGRISLANPFGLDDVFAMRLRPNPRRQCNPTSFARVAASAKLRWPEAVIQGD